MTGAAQRYNELRMELTLLRALSSEPLPQDDEARYATDLQRCWEAMTEEEQEQVEASLADDFVPSAEEDLAQEDEVVPEGGKVLPRKVAA